MRDAQTEYESCVDVYQLRIKALNKVGQTPNSSLSPWHDIILIVGRDRHTRRGGRQRAGSVLQLPAVPSLQRAGGQLHLRGRHCRLHQEVPGPDVWSPGAGRSLQHCRVCRELFAATLPALRVRLLHVSLQAQDRVGAGPLLLPPCRESCRPGHSPHSPLCPHSSVSRGREIVLIYFDNTGYFTIFLTCILIKFYTL